MAELVEAENPYGLQLYTVESPSGSSILLQNESEAHYYERQRDKYLHDNRFTNVSDVEDLARLLTLEVMVHRWSNWLTQGFDYLAGRVNETELKTNIKEYCLSEDTQALTRRGWKRFIDLVPGEDILTLNTATGLSEWQSPRTIHVFRPTGPLMQIETREISALATTEHRWWVQRATKDRSAVSTREFRTTDQLDRYCWVPTAAQHGSFDTHHKQSDSFVELIAWWWTEGYADAKLHNGEIGQSSTANPHKVAMIRRALIQECGDPGDLRQGHLWNETLRADGMVMFNLSKRLVIELEQAAPDRIVSTWFLQSLTQAQLSLFIELSLHGDGYRNSGGGWSISQRREEQLAAFQVAAVLAGYQANMTFSSSINMWKMNLSRRDAARPLVNPVGTVEYDGLVWCPETPNGTWLARRNGRVFYTGNSVEIRLVKASLGIDRAQREKDKGETVGDYIGTLLERAKEFGVHRDDQYAKAVTYLWELISMIKTHDRCDEQERRELDLSTDSIVDWVRTTVVPEWDDLNTAFRANQKVWIADL